jgi:hypothetical protein
MSTPLDFALWYIQQHFFITPVHPGTKKPIPTGWPKLRLTPNDLPHHFRGTPNIGIILGDEYGTADADLDCIEAIVTGQMLLPATGMIYGRSSAPRSHYIFRCDPAVLSEKYLDPLEPDKDKATVAELRCLSKDGDEGMQSVVPPSIHPSGEDYRFENGGNAQPANIDAPVLQSAVRQVAASALLSRHWPGAKSGRNAAFLALAGAAARAGWTLEQTQNSIAPCTKFYGARARTSPKPMRKLGRLLKSTRRGRRSPPAPPSKPSSIPRW